MPSPTPKQRREIAKRHADKQAFRDNIMRREKQIHDRVQKLIDESVNRSKNARGYALDDILLGLEEARVLAMAISQPTAAVGALMAMAKVQGLIVEQVAHGAPQEFSALTGPVEDNRRQLLERMSERMGSRRAQKMIAVFDRMQDELDKNDDVVDVEASDSDGNHSNKN
jgi:hypothetical protein